jgi:Collagen triple helix repeat (20 copies)/Divergent InlB B-repeat domain
VTRQAKASSAAPIQRQAKGLGRVIRGGQALLVLAVAAIALLAIPALASAFPRGHHFLETFGSAQQPELGLPAGIAVDPASGDVYVIDMEDKTLHRFKPNGEPDNFSALVGENVIDGFGGADTVPGVEEILSNEAGSVRETQVSIAPPGSAAGTAGDIYVTNAFREQVDVFAPTGAYLGSTSSPSSPSYPCGVSVGPNGSVFIGDYYNGVQKLTPTAPGTFTEAAGSPFHEEVSTPCNVAAGYGPSAGSVSYSSYGGEVTKLDATSGTKDYEVFSGPSTGGLSVDPTTGLLYVANAHVASPSEAVVREFDVSGAAPEEVSGTSVPNVSGIGVNGTSGNFYISPSDAHKLDVYAPGPAVKTLTVSVSGSGAVSQVGGPTPLSGSISGCEASAGTCSAEYHEGDEPELEATPGANQALGSWTVEHAGATTCTGSTSPCTIEVGNENATAHASFVLAGFPLTIEKGGNGEGTVTSTESGISSQAINCGPHCSEAFNPSTLVHLQASEATGSEFSGWSTVQGNPGTCTGTTTPCEVTLSEAIKLKAGFALEEESFSVNQSGEGTLSCEDNASPASCSGPFPYGHTIKVTASPEAGWKLTSLSGTGSAAGNCSGAVCQFQITEASEASASFEEFANPATLTLFKGGSGQGTVTSLAPHTGISCSTSCEEAEITVEEGEAVELEETPAAGSVFGGWIGCRHISSSNRCVTTVSSAQTEVTAIFLATQTITPFTGAKGPCTEGGLEISLEGTTSYVCNGEEGAQGSPGSPGATGPTGPQGNPGATGPTGPKGPAGPAGATGAQGPAGANGAQGAKGDTGATGPQGPAGANAKVTCKVKGKRVTCTVKYSKSASTQSLHWRLMRGDHSVAHGTTKDALRLNLSHLPSGRYVLHAGKKSTPIVITPRDGRGNGGGAR